MKKWTERELKEAGYDISNALITSIDLSTSDYSVCVLAMGLEGNGWGSRFGNYSLGFGDMYTDIEEIDGSEIGMTYIMTLMNILESNSFIDLKDKYIRVAYRKSDNATIIGHLIKDRWFDQKSFFEDKKEE